jgi:uncharacterized membrane protein
VATKLARKAGRTTQDTAGKATKAAAGAPSVLLKGAVQQLLSTVGQRAASSLTDRVSSTAQRLNDYADSDRAGSGVKTGVTGARNLAKGKSPMRSMLSTGFTRLKDKVKEAFGGGSGSGGKKLKVTNIVETIDIGVPVGLAYAQWTRFTEFPKFMKKVENVEQPAPEKVEWKAQIFWSHRSWESKILEQVPNERIVWRSKGQKGHVNGAVTFHEIAPGLTRVVLVLEYHPQGLFERTGNLWRAQGRRVRLELKHFRRHVMTEAILHQDEIEGWQGEIHDGKVAGDEESEEDTSEDREDADDNAEAGDAEPEDTEPEDTEPEDIEARDEEDEPEERPKRRRASTGRGSSSRTATKTKSTKTRTGGHR